VGNLARSAHASSESLTKMSESNQRSVVARFQIGRGVRSFYGRGSDWVCPFGPSRLTIRPRFRCRGNLVGCRFSRRRESVSWPDPGCWWDGLLRPGISGRSSLFEIGLLDHHLATPSPQFPAESSKSVNEGEPHLLFQSVIGTSSDRCTNFVTKSYRS
jgi:hypothetical protein